MVEVGQGCLEHFTMSFILSSLQLGESAGPCQSKILALSPFQRLLWRQPLLCAAGGCSGLGLLLFYRLAFPTSRHGCIIGHLDACKRVRTET